jgi:hypothetical protein
MPNNIQPPGYIESIANKILAKYRRLDSTLTHAPSKGTYHENIIRKLLRDYLPNTYSVGEGFGINTEGYTTSQLDVLVVDNLDPRSFGFKEDGFFIASDIAICSFGEVKTLPTKVEFINSFHKLIESSKIMGDPARITSFIFCYDVPVGKRAFFNWIEDAMATLDPNSNYRPWHFPDYVFCLKKNVMKERRRVSPTSVQYLNISTENNDSNIIQQKIIQDLIGCVTNGCGRLRTKQNIVLQKK